MFKIFTMSNCRYCTLAKSALDAHGFEYEEVEADAEQKAQLVAVGLTTLPQIYFQPLMGRGDETPTHIGGYDGLCAWLASNDL